MYSQITYATVQGCGSRRCLEIKSSPQINVLQSRDPEGFLLALAGLFGGLPGNFFQEEEYAVRADVTWTDDLSCKLCACFSKEEQAVWVHSVDDTKSSLSARSPEKMKAIHKRRFRYGTNTAHIFDNSSQLDNCELLGESDATLQRFFAFLEETHRRTMLGDTRPLFLYNFLERLDEAVDLQPIFEALLSTGRQVFIAVPHNYRVENLEGKGYGAAIHDGSNPGYNI